MDELIGNIKTTSFFGKCSKLFYANLDNADYELMVVERSGGVVIGYADMNKEYPDFYPVVWIDPCTGDLLVGESDNVIGNVLTNATDEVVVACGFGKEVNWI
ncbi:MAG: hypothetical protein WC763_06700 [Candidatus Paceibacterota bacterium]|jgi:hypothetical protein